MAKKKQKSSVNDAVFGVEKIQRPKLFMRLRPETTQGGPALMAILARVLMEHGATVRMENPLDMKIPIGVPDLTGLEVQITRSIWIREEEAQR